MYYFYFLESFHKYDQRKFGKYQTSTIGTSFHSGEMDTEKSNSLSIRNTHHRSNVFCDDVFQDVQSISAKVKKICQGKSCTGK